ncbi:MAG: PEP-CTERM sorting domain-containing protein [Fimbriimonadaceae bacterium]|nr:PEP-CTERM sorting domain-containing protein [Fimbriimonadaceae bacterium]
MKKIIPILALAAVAAASQAVTIYDVQGGTAGFSFFNTPGAERAGDNFLVASAGAGMHWRITEMRGVMFSSAAGVYAANSRVLTINVWNGTSVSGVASDPAFTSLAGTATVTFAPSFTATAAGSGQTWTVTGLNIDLADNPANTSGYSIEYIWNSTSDTGAKMLNGFKNGGSIAAGSSWSNGFFADFSPNNDGVIRQNEFYNGTGWTNGNLSSTIIADAVQSVPEPATMTVLGLGLAGFLARRKRK